MGDERRPSPPALRSMRSLNERIASLSGTGVSPNSRNALEVAASMSVTTSASQRRGTIWILLDVSSSMEGDPLVQARDGVAGFARDAITRRYAVGVISFASSPSMVAHATQEVVALEKAVQQLSAGGSTDMASAISLATTQFSAGPGERIIFLVTDGQPDSRPAALAAGRVARDAGIGIMTLGTTDADHEFLKTLASQEDFARDVPTADLRRGIEATTRLLLTR